MWSEPSSIGRCPTTAINGYAVRGSSEPLEERTQVPRGAGPRQRMIKNWLVLPKGENSSSRPSTGSTSDENSVELQDLGGMCLKELSISLSSIDI
jgi:hypothetical protein